MFTVSDDSNLKYLYEMELVCNVKNVDPLPLCCRQDSLFSFIGLSSGVRPFIFTGYVYVLLAVKTIFARTSVLDALFDEVLPLLVSDSRYAICALC